MATHTGSSSNNEAVAGTDALLNLGQFPDFARLELASIVPTMERLLASIAEEFAEQEKLFTPTWAGTFGRVEALEDRLARSFGVVNHLSMVMDRPIIREAMETIKPRMVELELRMQQSRALYDMRDTKTHWMQLTQPQRRVVDRRLLEMEQAGVGFDPASPERARNDAIHQELTTLSLKFSNNLLDAIKQYGRLVEDRQALAGCPDTLLRSMAMQAKQRGYGTGDAGKWAEALREEVYRANIVKASSGTEDNRPIIHRMLQLRQEQAELLGYPHYAAMSLTTKMARSLDRAMGLVDVLRERAYEQSAKELDCLTEYAHKTLNLPGPLQPWNTAFVSERYREATLKYDEEMVTKHFPAPHVLACMFSLAEQLFGVKIREMTRDTHPDMPSVWHKDVKVFEVCDRDGQRPLAYFYGDFYSRPEEKRSGAWMDICATRWKQSDHLRLPVAYLICNQPAPLSENEPSLMKFSDVTTLFHEFGHCLQHLLTTEDMPQVASQFMENFCYEKEWLKQLSKHVDTGAPLPDDVIEALQKERIFLSGLATQRQLLFAHIDLELHSTPVEDSIDWPFEVDRRVSRQYKVPARLDTDRFLCSFAHIFAGGYSAGYYSYKWSEVYSADAYAAFMGRQGEALRRVGQRYRDTVLALGGSTDPSTVWQRFLGRSEADVEPLLRQDGLLQQVEAQH
ncbi:hypothetical protein SYNPS1DRAFT_32798 [Syncephalis pseudoplumigaleata]|uniref:oligopeptidase A n=1 Tax=Syncephalis pseudoplumigaleata TaxID=1712513 RepID=A0A4V1J1T5_9FUNG|nr:hypothetical protein SYNPS1DRAFT_32798 [Syncephalis pseudoplumigaleata]|eukprot:RKP26179.1 hypothetical protein SYNPS1DRAFT_32798 [Syncephalis pseudoplumigaleata]